MEDEVEGKIDDVVERDTPSGIGVSEGEFVGDSERDMEDDTPEHVSTMEYDPTAELYPVSWMV